MRLSFLAAAAAAAAALAIPSVAAAQDMAPGAAPFTGFRAEALAGYDALGDDVDGFLYGGAIGFDVQAGALTIGAEAEIADSTAKVRDSGVIVVGDSIRLTAGRDLYVGGRVGFALSPIALVYAKGGYTNARFNVDYSGSAGVFDDNLDADGYRIGAGLEYQVSPNFYVKGEYRYSNYSEADDIEFDADRSQIVGGIGFRF